MLVIYAYVLTGRTGRTQMATQKLTESDSPDITLDTSLNAKSEKVISTFTKELPQIAQYTLTHTHLA